ncbi:BspA family leucine-rich repeat surface protein [Lactobacillus helsingborgensis]|uniref:BspA family leucine-rich repeat surface protein n=1 Tax=Lactobacillus helsingborgensis TaxID=1218494 RepID=UPI002264AA09|nr:BspA family leucine-rich repeat surface protein [Lactobacillus helsingborgensis]UZX31813.1 BspA family leucine-rich repeat surface protein [Lactobacillus helsingborgensis]
MNKGLDHNKRTGALLFSSLTAAALGLMSLNTNVVKADSNSGTQDTARSFNKNDNDSRVKTRVANNTVSQANNQGVTTDNANTTAPEGNANGTTDNADETQNGSVDSPQGNNKDSNSQTSAGNDQPETDITKNENNISTKTIKTGKWGNADVRYDSDTNVLTVSGSHDKDNPTIVSNAGLVAGFLGQDGPDPECTHVKKVTFDGYFKVVGDVKSVFIRLRGLTDIEGLENVDTSEATTMYAWFSQCSSLKHVDLSHFNTSNVKNMYCMFDRCTNLEDLDLSKFDTSQVKDMSYMFVGCKSLKELDLQNFNTSQVTNMSWMFAGCESLEKLNVTSFNTANVKDMSFMFNHCASLTNIDVHSFDTKNVENMKAMFSMYYSYASDTSSVFGWDSSLVSLDLSNFNTSKVTDMSSMFFKCTKLKDLNISSFDTSQVTNMISMFNGCNKLTYLDLRNFDTANVTNMSYMFRDTNSLVGLNLSSFNTSKVTSMSQMFYLYANPKVDGKYPKLSNLRTLDISNFDMSSNGNTYDMLKGHQNLLVLKLGKGNKLVSIMGLDTPGTWLNVGKKTMQDPEGSEKWSSDELMKNWQVGAKDETYVRETTITAHYQDEKGKTLAPDETYTGTYGTPYEAKVKEIPGYVLTAMPKNAKGLIGENVDDIMFIYQKPTNNGKTPVKAADVTVHYEDENGNQIAPNVILSGNVGDGYQTEIKTISGYTLKARPNNATGFFTSQPQDVVYVYTKNDQSAKEPGKEPGQEPSDNDNSHNSSGNSKPNKNKKGTHKTNKKATKESKSTSKPNEGRRQSGKSTGASKKTRTLAQTGSDRKSQVGMLLLGASALILSLLGVEIERRRKE